MGWCHEFGPQIRPDCDHPMAPGVDACHCVQCGIRCEGRFHGCSTVWARGAVQPAFVAPRPNPSAPANGAQPPERPKLVPTLPAPEPAVPPRPALPSDDVLRRVVSALDTVGAELRAMRAVVETARAAPETVATAGRAVEALTELLDRLPYDVGAAVRAAVHDERAGSDVLSDDSAAEYSRADDSRAEDSRADEDADTGAEQAASGPPGDPDPADDRPAPAPDPGAPSWQSPPVAPEPYRLYHAPPDPA